MGQKIDLTRQVQGVLLEANGGAGPNIGQRFSDSETPSGATNGVNVTFTLLEAPNPALSLLLFLSKTLQIQGTDYTLSGGTITMTVAPGGGTTSFLAWYRYLTFGMALIFSDGMVLSDAALVDAPVAQLPMGLSDQMGTITDRQLDLVLTPSLIRDSDIMILSDAFASNLPVQISKAFIETMIMHDAFVKTLA